MHTEPRSGPPASTAADREHAYLEQLFHDAPEGMVLLDDRDCVLRANREFFAMFGLPAAAIGRPVNRLIVPASRTEEAERITRRVAAGERVEVETVRCRADGAPIEVSLLATPIRLPGGQIGVAAIYRDISRQIEATRERERLHAREHILAEAGAALADTLDYRATFVNLARLVVPALADYCLIDELEEDGSLRRVAFAHADPGREALLYRDACHPPDADPALHPTVAVARSGEPVLVESVTEAGLDRLAHEPEHRAGLAVLQLRSYLILPLTARKRTLGTLTLALAESGRHFGPADLPLARELACRAATAVDNARLFAQAQRAIAARDRVVATVSHDLRNPLAGILLDATALLDDDAPPEARERAGRIAAAVERMDRMIRDLLDVARIGSGHFPVLPAPVEVGTLTSAATEMQHSLAAARGVVLVSSPAPPGVRVRADRERLLQVFSNLLSNALRLTPPGGRVAVGVAREAGEVRFRVSDTGPGIAPEHLPQLWEPFWQVPGHRGGGSGLGLAIARGVVEAHGGRIWAESVPGEGATFCFTIPALPEGE